jgi:hypothetical protein
MGRVLGPLSKWFGVRFLVLVYGKNSVGRGELCVPHRFSDGDYSSLTAVESLYIMVTRKKRLIIGVRENKFLGVCCYKLHL